MYMIKVDVDGITRGMFHHMLYSFFYDHRWAQMTSLIYHPMILLANGHHCPSTLQATPAIPDKSTLRLSIERS